MTTYITMIKYTVEGVTGISEDRINDVREAIQRVGGKHVTGYQLLGNYDAMIIAEYPDEKIAMRANIEIMKLIKASLYTMSAVQIEDFSQDLACYM